MLQDILQEFGKWQNQYIWQIKMVSINSSINLKTYYTTDILVFRKYSIFSLHEILCGC